MTGKTASRTTSSPGARTGSAALRVSAPIMAFGGAITLALLWGYLSAVFLYGEPSLPIRFGTLVWFATTGIVAGFGYAALMMAFRREWLSVKQAQLPLLSTLSLLFSAVFLDTAYTLYLNTTVSNNSVARNTDEHSWIGELYPRLYYPTEYTFRIHKPGVRVTGTHFGSFYDMSMLASPTLVDRVLESNRVTISINDRGFRESSPMARATIFALGDSFTFGWGMDEGSEWPELVESLTGQTVYNLGIHDASPQHELDLLKFVLRNYEESRGIRHLLWMIFEGNDLEDDFAQLRPERVTTGGARGTLLRLLGDVPSTIKEQSVIWKLRNGRVALAARFQTAAYNPYLIDGVQLVHPLYHSEAFGPRLFYNTYIERAQAPESYVQAHPNRAHLETVFHEMAELSREFDFEVSVLLIPTAARLYGPLFENFPELSEKPYFLDYVAQLSESSNFRVLDLYELLKPYAASELLYFHDDDHFNQRGHEVVAGIIQKELFEN